MSKVAKYKSSNESYLDESNSDNGYYNFNNNSSKKFIKNQFLVMFDNLVAKSTIDSYII